MAPRSSWPTMWKEFLPISMPTTAIAALSVWVMARSLSLVPRASIAYWWGGSTAGPSHYRTLAEPDSESPACYNSIQFSEPGCVLSSERVERRLAAVLAADVAGYSRLMGIDEERTLARLKGARKALVDPTLSKDRGRIVKTTGDGMLVEFASAVDAVRGAVEVQRGMADQNASVPQDQRIEFRIGIHVGDIIIDESDIFGEGVNI